MSISYSQLTTDLGLPIRKEILFTSLAVEGLTSAFLSTLLEIKDYKNSRTLGNKSGSLSFNQKVDLLIDIGALSKEDKNKFQVFMEIRNQFIHNLSATTYEKCFGATGGTDKCILKIYPQSKNISREEQLEEATKELGNEVIKLIFDLTKRIEEKNHKKLIADIAIKSEQAFFEAIEKMKNTVDDHFDIEITKANTYQ